MVVLAFGASLGFEGQGFRVGGEGFQVVAALRMTIARREKTNPKTHRAKKRINLGRPFFLSRLELAGAKTH